MLKAGNGYDDVETGGAFTVPNQAMTDNINNAISDTLSRRKLTRIKKQAGFLRAKKSAGPALFLP